MVRSVAHHINRFAMALRHARILRHVGPMKQIAAFTLLALPVQAAAQTAAPLEFGVFCTRERMEQQAAPDTVQGAINIVPGGNQIRWSQAQVPTAIGVGFGIWYDVSDLGPGMIETVITHPPVGADGIKRESWQSAFVPGDSDRRYTGFSMEYDEELVQGLWQFRIYHDGQLIAQQQFHLVPESNFPTIVAACSGVVLSS